MKPDNPSRPHTGLLRPPFAELTSPFDESRVTGGMARPRIELAGRWARYVRGTLLGYVDVPSSQRPMGSYRLQRQVLLPRVTPAQQVILHFDAILCHGTVLVNDHAVGTMGPFVPYEFNIAPYLIDGSNTIAVDIVDVADCCSAPEGEGQGEIDVFVNFGWEFYGGIIRDVYIEVRPAACIDNLRLAYTFSAQYREAACRTRLFVSATRPAKGKVRLTLNDGSADVAAVEKEIAVSAGNSETELAFAVESPSLWSPESPRCYRLTAQLTTEHGSDVFSTGTGFRSFVVRGNTFELNGRPVILKGVCRHDMWKDQGFTLTREQMAQDMRMIKALGCNFVRLVHYPHHRHVVELADQLGLMVSEEPGYWNQDIELFPRAFAEVGLRIMERVIRRDWNSPSVVAWLASNECTLTDEYLREAKALYRSLDPLARLVSAANAMPWEKAKPVFEQAGMDFFTQHPYTTSLADFQRAADYYGPGKPLVFTEWGGKSLVWAIAHADEADIGWDTMDCFLDLTEAGQLAGHAYWSWQDIPQFTRVDAEMRDGVLESGVVTESREVRPHTVAALSRLFQGVRRETTRPVCDVLETYPWSSESRFTPVDMQALAESDRSARAWADLEERMKVFNRDQWQRTGETFRLWQAAETSLGEVTFLTPKIKHHIRPVVVTPAAPEISIPIHMACSRIHVLGNVTLPCGYPARGKAGDRLGCYLVRYEDGTTQEIPLRSGYEVARANIILMGSRINPVAVFAPRALCFVKDWVREQYQALLYSIPVAARPVESITCRWQSRDTCLMLFAVTVEQSRGD